MSKPLSINSSLNKSLPKSLSTKLKPSDLIQKQVTGNLIEDLHQKPKIVQFLNLADFSIYTDSKVGVDEPLFEPIPPLIQFTDFEPLQIKEKVFKLRNKDIYARRVKIIQPDSRLFQVLPANSVRGGKETKENDPNNVFGGNKVAPGIDITFIIRFSPEAKIDYSYDLVVVTEREKFIVPIIAVGKRAMIDFPDVLDFGNCPVKYLTEKPVIIRNLGEKTTKWFLKLPNSFDANKKEGVLEYGKNEQIVITFYPMEAKTYKNEILLAYDNMEATVQLLGLAHNGNVYLSKSYIQMEEAYISLQTQQTLQIINKSNVKVDFQWRAFATEKEEQEKKNKLHSQLDQEEAEEKMLLKEIVSNEIVQEEIEIEDQDDSEEEERDEKALLLRRQHKAELLLARKYKNIRKAIEDDQLLFQDDIFSIEPSSGQIWPNSEMTITVTFKPQGALHYSCTSFCNISCSADRLALHLAGEGIGPKAYLSMVEKSLGDVFVTQNKPMDLMIENKGEIEARFELIPNETPFGKMFHFQIEKGVLGVGERIPFHINFCSTILGEFSETFKWRLEGSTETLSILFTGHVIAPTFTFSKDEIRFKRVSYSFPKSKKIKIQNTSDVEFTFQLKIPGDGKTPNTKEFEIKPSRDTLQPKEIKEIAVTLISQMPREYKMVMVVDIVGVGQDMLSIPISGISEVPKVEIEPSDHLDFGEIFLNYPDKAMIQLRNKNDLEARYEILPQNEESKILAEYSVDKPTGIIGPDGSEIITVTLVTKKLREITLPLQINIVGNTTGNPHTINIIANSNGPKVEIGVTQLDFDKVEVLVPVPKKFLIKNVSNIEADFHAFTKNKPSIFKPIQKHAILKPKESMEIEVICTADDVAVFQDILHFVIKDGFNQDVILKARGIGTTLFWKEDLRNINFGTQYTHRLIPREIFVENKGRKMQKLRWQAVKVSEKKKNQDQKPTAEVKQPAPEVVIDEDNIFTIIPEKIDLPPRSGIMFQFHCYSTKPGLQKLDYKLNASVGNDRKEAPIVTSRLEGNFINPSLIFSENKIRFKYSWAKNVPLMPISENLQITCGCELPTRFLLKVAPPFSINKEEFSLLPGKNATLRIDFDPGLKTDKVSAQIPNKLQISHIDHPHKEFVDLVGELCFPNIKLSSDVVNFRSILCETSKKKYLTIKNTSEMSINYEWSFLEDELRPEESTQLESKKKINVPAIPINEIFDILPLSGHLQPNEEEQVEFIFNALNTQRYRATALCKVEGGPAYEISLMGDASLIHYRIQPNPYILDIGDIRFMDRTAKEFIVENTGKVPFQYSVNISSIIRKGLIEVNPPFGRIEGNEKQRFLVKVCPGMPDLIKEQFSIEIGYNEPETIKITGKGVCPALLMSLPRVDRDEFVQKVEEEKKKLSEDEQKIMQMYLKFLEKARKNPVEFDHINMIEKVKNNLINQNGPWIGKGPENALNDIEYEIDRRILCDEILKNINEFAQQREKSFDMSAQLERSNTKKFENSAESAPHQPINRNDVRLFEKIILATYTCDFGNIVLNTSKKRVFKVMNMSQLPLEFVFEAKHFKNAGFTVTPERVKIPAGESLPVTINYQTKKNMKCEKIKKILPVDVKHGPKYQIELLANITIPEITLENEAFDFGRVLINQRKTMYLRFLNEKEVPCEWSLSTRPDITSGDQKEARFSINPIMGTIQPGHKELVQVIFAPNSEKVFNHKFTIIIKENSQPLVINLKGSGTTINLEFTPSDLSIGPVLPYEDGAFTCLQIQNPSDYSTELINLDFDKEIYLEEEKLAKFPEFDTTDQVYFPVREPGGRFWDFVSSAYQKSLLREGIEKKLESSELNEEERAAFLKQLDDLKISSKSNDYPRKVEDKYLHHVVILGPPGSGKSTLASGLAGLGGIRKDEGRRGIVNLNELLEWNLSQKTPAAEKAEAYLSERRRDMENVLAERDKIIKKAGKKAKQKEEELGPFNEAPYHYLTEEILEEMLQQRLSHPDCNAGCIFDNLSSRHYPSELIGLKLILKVLRQNTIQVLLLSQEEDESGLPVDKIIEWDNMEKTFEHKPGAKKKGNKEKPKPKKEEGVVKKEDPAGKKEVGGKESLKEKEILEVVEETPPLFDVALVKEFESEEARVSWETLMREAVDLVLLQMKEGMKDKLEIPKPPANLVEEKKEVPKKKDPKKKKGEDEEPEVIPPNPLEVLANLLQSGNRILTKIPIQHNALQLLKNALDLVPAPIYPDPSLLPIPDPIYHQILTRPSTRPHKEESKHFSILTPKHFYKSYYDDIYLQKKKAFLEANSLPPPSTSNLPPSEGAPPQPIIIPAIYKSDYDWTKEKDLQKLYGFKIDDLIIGQNRWIIPAKKSLILVLKFFTKNVGQYDAKLNFEAFYSVKKYEVAVVGKSDFPSISTFPKNIYWNVKKNRPSSISEGLISKSFVISENQFDFGPLLIGKNPANRHLQAIKNVNSTTFRISNQGKFDCELSFDLMSSVLQNDEYKKEIFFFEPEKVKLKIDDPPAEIRVWALPDQPRKFRDDLIVMIKDNPSPVILPMMCLGQKPVVEILEGENLIFERMLLKQAATKEIKLRNACSIPLKWKLNNLNSLPEEYSVTNTSGELKPNQETKVEVTFKALKQSKFKNNLVLEVVDVENMGIKQEAKNINIEAESFNITVEFKFPNNNEEFLLDFGSLRVYEVKEQTFTIKNTGLYKIKYAFNMKKKLFRECFKIEPNEAELEAGQEKIISVKFSSKSELKLKTQLNTTDMIIEILEGKTLEVFKPIPINVAVNAVFSKYSILPLKSINFGPLQFNDTKTRQFVIKNEGLFEFSYTIFDFNNEEARKVIKAAQEQFLEELKGAAPPPLKPGQKAPPKEQKKPAGKKGGKEELPNTIKIGQWSIAPCLGSIPPESSATVDVIFQGNGAKLFEQKLGIDIMGRDPGDSPEGLYYEVIAESCIPGISTENYEGIFEEQIVVPSLSTGQNITSLVHSNVFAVEEKTFFFGTLVPSKNPDGIMEKFKISNPNKIPCNVKFDVRKRAANSTENFAFEVQPKVVKIQPHEHTYVKVFFKPAIMATYSGIFEAVVENGEQNPKTHKLLFDLRGEGALPTLKIEKPKDLFDERTTLMKFPRTRVEKASQLPLVLKNDGQVPATVKFDLTPNESFKFLGQATFSLLPKTYQTFHIEFKPKSAGNKQWIFSMTTLNNPYETSRIMAGGDAFYEELTFEGLPDDLEEEVNLGDCVVAVEKKIVFAIRNNSSGSVRFNWNAQGCEDFNFMPRMGHLAARASKNIVMSFKALKTTIHKQFQIFCETIQIQQNGGFRDWDDSMSNIRYVTRTEFEIIMRKREEEIQRRRAEEAQAAAAKKQKKPGGKEEKKVEVKKPIVKQDPIIDNVNIDPNEEANVPLEEPINEPDYQTIEKTEKALGLKVSGVADFVRYEIDAKEKEILFRPTMMYTSRVYPFRLRNTSAIKMKYICKLVHPQTGIYDAGYYLVTPKTGAISPGCDEIFSVKFSPTEVDDLNHRLLVISMESLDPTLQPLIIELDGEAERPICHFELPPSSRDKKPDLDLKYNIVEIESLGTKVRNQKKFYVVNPTNQGYEFEWKRIDEDKLPAGANPTYAGFFKCVTQKGVVLSGKKYETIFEYNPDTPGVHESYWTFEIPADKIIQHFLIIGTVKEPNVFIDVGKVNFGPLLLGGKNKETVRLKNMDDVPIPFYFDKESLKGDTDYADCLIVNPVSGVVKGDSEIPIEITFIPKQEREFNYNLLCFIKRKTRPICLNVKGIGYILHHQVFYEGSNAVLIPEERTIIDFGEIFVNEKQGRKVIIENNGDFNFDFALKKQSQISFVTITPEFGTVKKKEKLEIEILFAPIAEYSFNSKQSQIALSIISGPIYMLDLKGKSRKPGVELSFLNYNFGPCFVLKQPLSVSTILEIRNRDNAAMSIETLYERKPYLDFQLASGQVLLPLQYDKEKKESNVLKIPIVFTPREFMFYEEIITLDINNLYKMDVKIQGEGIQFKLELDKTEDQHIDFGVLRVSQESIKTVSLMNYSKKAISITLDTGNQITNLQKYFISLSPIKEFTIQPRERKDLEIRFNPKSRLHHFKEEIFYKITENQETRKLLNIAGSCHGVEVKIMEDTLGFGPVVINSKLTKTLQMANLGDVGTRFEWETQFCSKYFSLSPESGFIPPHEDLYFEVTFHPNVVDNDISFKKVKCNIQDSDPLFVNLIGKCVPQPKETIQEIKFETVVRTIVKQKLFIKNPTPKPWRIKASLSSFIEAFKGYFEGKDYIEVPANGQAEYEITYKPLTMTKNALVPEIKDEIHECSLFFPLPDGSALLYTLIGKSNPPQIAGTFDIVMKAKKAHIQVLQVKNWLKNVQRFNVFWQMEVEDPTLFISGANTIDVGEISKDYKLSLNGLKQGNNKITVTFKNPINFEFVFFKLNVNVGLADAIGKLELVSVVRDTVSKIITIENPLNNPVTFKKEFLTADHDTITFNPMSFTIPPKSEFGVEIIFRPLLATELQSKCKLSSPELGDFIYSLHLIGLPSTIQRSMIMKAPLGTDFVQNFKFTHYLKKPIVYACRIEKLGSKAPVDPKAKGLIPVDFATDSPNINAPPSDSYEGVEVGVNIKFEPSTLNESRAMLFISSPEAGEYSCILIGQSSAPQPKGPFKIAGPKPPAIDFKNPFFEACEFIIRVDNPSFAVSAKSPMKIDAKKGISIQVSYKPVPNGSSNGRLIISTGDLPPWVFYLQGE